MPVPQVVVFIFCIMVPVPGFHLICTKPLGTTNTPTCFLPASGVQFHFGHSDSFLAFATMGSSCMYDYKFTVNFLCQTLKPCPRTTLFIIEYAPRLAVCPTVGAPGLGLMVRVGKVPGQTPYSV